MDAVRELVGVSLRGEISHPDAYLRPFFEAPRQVLGLHRERPHEAAAPRRRRPRRRRRRAMPPRQDDVMQRRRDIAPARRSASDWRSSWRGR